MSKVCEMAINTKKGRKDTKKDQKDTEKDRKDTEKNHNDTEKDICTYSIPDIGDYIGLFPSKLSRCGVHCWK